MVQQQSLSYCEVDHKGSSQESVQWNVVWDVYEDDKPMDGGSEGINLETPVDNVLLAVTREAEPVLLNIKEPKVHPPEVATTLEDFINQVEVPIAWGFCAVNNNKEALVPNCSCCVSPRSFDVMRHPPQSVMPAFEEDTFSVDGSLRVTQLVVFCESKKAYNDILDAVKTSSNSVVETVEDGFVVQPHVTITLASPRQNIDFLSSKEVLHEVQVGLAAVRVILNLHLIFSWDPGPSILAFHISSYRSLGADVKALLEFLQWQLATVWGYYDSFDRKLCSFMEQQFIHPSLSEDIFVTINRVQYSTTAIPIRVLCLGVVKLLCCMMTLPFMERQHLRGLFSDLDTVTMHMVQLAVQGIHRATRFAHSVTSYLTWPSDITLLTARALTHLCDVLLSSCAAVVPVLNKRLREFQVLVQLSTATAMLNDVVSDISALKSTLYQVTCDQSATYFNNVVDSSYDKSTLICENIAKKVFPRESNQQYAEIDDTRYAYIVRNRLRKEVISPLRGALALPEIYMSAKKGDSLPYERVASVAMKLLKKLFVEHDLERFTAHLENVKTGKAKIAAGALIPHEILKSLDEEDGEQVSISYWCSSQQLTTSPIILGTTATSHSSAVVSAVPVRGMESKDERMKATSEILQSHGNSNIQGSAPGQTVCKVGSSSNWEKTSQKLSLSLSDFEVGSVTGCWSTSFQSAVPQPSSFLRVIAQEVIVTVEVSSLTAVSPNSEWVQSLRVIWCSDFNSVAVKSVTVRGIWLFDPGIDGVKLYEFSNVWWCATFFCVTTVMSNRLGQLVIDNSFGLPSCTLHLRVSSMKATDPSITADP